MFSRYCECRSDEGKSPPLRQLPITVRVLGLLGRTLSRAIALVITSLLMMGVAVAGNAQIVPAQVEQNQLDRRGSAGDIRNNPQAEGRISQLQAVNLARQAFPGNILRISLIGEGENQRYQIRMENEGRVFTVFVHAITGRVTGGT